MLVLSSRIGNTLAIKIGCIGNMLFLSYSCIVGNTFVPELSGCYWNILVLNAVVVLGTCLLQISNVLKLSVFYWEHACS